MRIKRYCIIFYLLVTVSLCNSQNLIPNPGFDMLTECPDDIGQIELAFPWISSRFTPDLYNKCSSSDKIKVPNVGQAPDSYQQPLSGGGYAAISVYSLLNNYARELLGVPLKSTLIKDGLYYIRFFVSPDLSPSMQYWRYSDAVALGFTSSPTFIDVEPDTNFRFPIPIAIENLGTMITDTSGWTKIDGCYRADGTETFAIIGNFRPNSEVLFEQEFDIGGTGIYLYIEDVLVMEFDPLPDTLIICEGEEIGLDASFLDATYRWSTGDESPQIDIGNEGEYIVDVIFDDCIMSDTVLVLRINEDTMAEKDTMICEGDNLILEQPIYGDVLWSTGATSSSISVKQGGNYTATVTNKCGEFNFNTRVDIKTCSCDINLPNIFSPNKDGFNDEIEVNVHCDYNHEIQSFSVYDRWGNKVYHSTDHQQIIWDGTFEGSELTSGVYVWILKYAVLDDAEKINKIATGDIMLIK